MCQISLTFLPHPQSTSKFMGTCFESLGKLLGTSSGNLVGNIGGIGDEWEVAELFLGFHVAVVEVAIVVVFIKIPF